MKFVSSLSIITHTPIPFWLELPLRELFVWQQAISELKGRGKRG